MTFDDAPNPSPAIFRPVEASPSSPPASSPSSLTAEAVLLSVAAAGIVLVSPPNPGPSPCSNPSPGPCGDDLLLVKIGLCIELHYVRWLLKTRKTILQSISAYFKITNFFRLNGDLVLTNYNDDETNDGIHSSYVHL